VPTALERLEDGLFRRSRDMGPPWGPVLRILRYPAAITRDWLTGEISVQAMSLAYTTLLSLVPLLVFSFAVLKGIGASSVLHFILREFFRPLGGAANQLTESVLEFVSNMRGDVLGSIGFIFLAYTVISTIQKVETSFNFVWRVDRHRSFVRRLTEYLSLMVIGPTLLGVTLGLLSSAVESPVARWLDTIAHLSWLLSLLGRLLPYAIVIVVFTFLYWFIPNIRVEFRPALIGGLTAGIVWAVVGQLFAAVLVYSSRMMVVYSSFAIVLSTLIWVYLSWLILLIGAELAFYVQFPQHLPHSRESGALVGGARERIGMSIMYLLARAHRKGEGRWSAARLATELDIPRTALAPILASLSRSGLIVATDREEFVPGRDADGIKILTVLEALRAPQGVPFHERALEPVASVLAKVETATRRELGELTLKDLIED